MKPNYQWNVGYIFIMLFLLQCTRTPHPFDTQFSESFLKVSTVLRGWV